MIAQLSAPTLARRECRGWAGDREFGKLWLTTPTPNEAAAEYAKAVKRAWWEYNVDRVLVDGRLYAIELEVLVKVNLTDLAGEEAIFR